MLEISYSWVDINSDFDQWVALEANALPCSGNLPYKQ
jgi:hypothetical protein